MHSTVVSRDSSFARALLKIIPPLPSASARLRNQAEISELRDQMNDRSAHITRLKPCRSRRLDRL